MDIRVTTYERLSSDEVAAWSTIQRDHAEFESPYFRPEFTELMSSVRPDVEVAVLEQTGAPVGFFPFQRGMFNAGQPVGGGFSEFHGLIASPEIQCDASALLRACRLSSWRFHHLVPAHPSFARFAWSRADSPYIDLSDGFDQYLAQRPNGRSLLSKHRQSKRRLERQFGPFRFASDVTAPEILETCIRWKAEQAQRNGLLNIFKYSWMLELLHGVLRRRSPDFASAMFVCYAGDQIAAINFGARSGPVFHTWFPTYNLEFAAHSPGTLLWMETMMAAETIGIRRILLGEGDEPYKKRLMNGADCVAIGCVDVRATAGMARRAVRETWRRTRQMVRASPLHGPAQMPARVVRSFRTWLAFR